MAQGSTSVLYLFEGAFSLWRRRLRGVYAQARELGWHVEPINADDEGGAQKERVQPVQLRRHPHRLLRR